MVKISWNTEKGYWGTWDTALCTWGGIAAGVGGVLSGLLCRIVSWPCSHVSWTVFDRLAVYLRSAPLSGGLNVVRDLLQTKPNNVHVTALLICPKTFNEGWQDMTKDRMELKTLESAESDLKRKQLLTTMGEEMFFTRVRLWEEFEYKSSIKAVMLFMIST